MGYTKQTLKRLPNQVLIGDPGEIEIRATAMLFCYAIEKRQNMMLVRDRTGDIKGGGIWEPYKGYPYQDQFVGYIHK